MRWGGVEIRGVVSTEGIGLALAACPLHLFSRDAVSPLSSWKSWKPLNSCGMICSGCSDEEDVQTVTLC
eukprot:m.81888 g.81888  ORF g.81888 m.81888 type:complete len:69 (+) comp19511_c0_seq3:2647-2853(+)